MANKAPQPQSAAKDNQESLKAAPSAPNSAAQLQQVQELLFGQQLRSINQKIMLVHRDFKQAIADLEQKFEQAALTQAEDNKTELEQFGIQLREETRAREASFKSTEAIWKSSDDELQQRVQSLQDASAGAQTELDKKLSAAIEEMKTMLASTRTELEQSVKQTRTDLDGSMQAAKTEWQSALNTKTQDWQKTTEEWQKSRSELIDSQDALQQSKQELEKIAQAESRKVSDETKASLQDAQTQLSTAVENARKELEDTRDQLNKTRKDLEDTRRELDNTRKALENTITATQTQISSKLDSDLKKISEDKVDRTALFELLGGIAQQISSLDNIPTVTKRHDSKD